MRHREMIIQKGHVYSIKCTAHSTKPVQVKAKVGMSGPPYKEYWSDTVDLHDPPADVRRRVHDGRGRGSDRRVRVPLRRAERGRDAGALHGLLRRHAPRRSEVREAEEGGRGGADPRGDRQPDRLPAALPKLATVKSASKTPLKWELLKKGGAVAASGETKPVGKDAASGEDVHVVDFSSVTAPGKDYTLKVGSDVSHPFDIARRRLQEAQVRRARGLLSPAQRHRRSRCPTRAASSGRARPAT